MKGFDGERIVAGLERVRHLALAATIAALAALPAFAQVEVECRSSVRPQDVPSLLRLQQSGAWVPPNLPGDIEAAPILIPVTAHVIRRDDGLGGIFQFRIDAALEDANQVFAQAGIQFYQCGPIRHIDSTALFNVDSDAEVTELTSTQVYPTTINLYFVNSLILDGESYCGMGSFTSTEWQGVILRDDCSGIFDNPSTVPHELGHFFDLLHTHETAMGAECADGSNCETTGDLVCDTAADPGTFDDDACQYSGNATDPCGDSYDPDPRNLMSYAAKTCRDDLTPGQVARVRATLFNLRPELIGGGCASTLGSFAGIPSSGGAPQPGRPVMFARRACSSLSSACLVADDGGTTDDFITASVEVSHAFRRSIRLNLRIEADLGVLGTGLGVRDVTRYFRHVGGGRVQNPMTFEPGTTSLELHVRAAIARRLVDRMPVNVPFVVRLETPGATPRIVDYFLDLLGLRPAAGVYDDGVVEELVLSRSPVQAQDALVTRFSASDLPDPEVGWMINGVEIVGGEIGGMGLPGLSSVELRLEDPMNPGQPDLSAAGLLRSAGPITFGAAPSTRYVDFADLMLAPAPATPPDLFVLAYLNPGDSLAGTATAIAASDSAEGAVLVGNSSILLGGALPLVPLVDRDLMIRLGLDGEIGP